jgi:hypothetical protein
VLVVATTLDAMAVCQYTLMLLFQKKKMLLLLFAPAG